MQTIKPISIDLTAITSSLSGTAYYDKFGTYYPSIGAWSDATGYTIGQLAYYQTRVYQSVFNGTNTAHNPVTDNTNLATGLNYWVDVGALNKFAAFDTESNTQSIGLTDSYMFSFIASDTFNSIGFTKLNVDYITVSIVSPTDDTNIFYTQTLKPSTRFITTWMDWMTIPFPSATNLLFTDIIAYSGQKVIITAVKAGGIPRIGGITIGAIYDIGLIQYGTRLPMQDFSPVITDEFGNTKIVKRNVFRGIDGSLWCEANQAGIIDDLRQALSSVPTVWIGIPNQDSYYYNSLFMLGLATTFEPSIDGAEHFTVKLVVKEI